MQELNLSKPHCVTVDSRSNLFVTGVSDVPGFDDQTVNLITSMGTLVVKGQSLHICKLSLESAEVSVEGKISSLQYLGDNNSKGLMQKLFR
jgi:sporulation protein YabP